MASLSAAAFQQSQTGLLSKVEDLSIDENHDEAEKDAASARKAQELDNKREAESIEARNVENARKLGLDVDEATAALDRHRVEAATKAHAAAAANFKEKSVNLAGSRAVHETCVAYLNGLAINRNRNRRA